jgi:hypothetical protein
MSWESTSRFQKLRTFSAFAIVRKVPESMAQVCLLSKFAMFLDGDRFI